MPSRFGPSHCGQSSARVGAAHIRSVASIRQATAVRFTVAPFGLCACAAETERHSSLRASPLSSLSFIVAHRPRWATPVTELGCMFVACWIQVQCHYRCPDVEL